MDYKDHQKGLIKVKVKLIATRNLPKTKLLWSSGIGTPAGVSAPGFELWPLRNLHMGCSIRDRRPLHGEPHGDALAASLLTSVSSLDHLGGARILG